MSAAHAGEAPGTVDPGRFRATMASVPAPVTVITTLTDDRPHGTTVSAFMSLSAVPAMVAVALDRGSVLLGMLAPGDRVGINVLARDQSAAATTFARKGQDKFTGVPWHLEGGAPRLEGSGGWLLCEVGTLVEGGDHVLVLGTVLDATPAGDEPLTYHGRSYGTHVPLPRD